MMLNRWYRNCFTVVAFCCVFTPISTAAGGDAAEESAADLFGRMYWTNWPEGIYCAARDGSEVKLLIASEGADSLAIDAERGKIYWTVFADVGGKVLRANLEGSGIEEVHRGLNGPADMVLDTKRAKLYLTSIADRKIIVCPLDGSPLKDLIVGLEEGIDELALDAEHGKLYWSNHRAGPIKRANLDGTRVEDAVPAARASFGLSIDAANEKIYWIDIAGGSIQRAGLDGTNVETVITGLVAADGLALDAQNLKLYWTEEGKISHANTDGSAAEVLVSGKTSRYSSIVILPPPDPAE